jgi:cysteine desulfurase family protein (TIGR01976 family)
MFDVDFARRQFPALQTPWALFDNAGGSVVPVQVIDRVTDYLSRHCVQLGASYALSEVASARVADGLRAAAELVHAAAEEIVIGSSTTMNVYVLAQSLPWREGDELVVTNLDHEANIGAWRRLAERGVVVREWRFRTETGMLEVEDLEPLLTERTQLVCFTHCSNIVGAVHEVAAIARAAHAAGAKICVDGVAYAPHRRVDVRALGVDFYLLSLYKVYGPHLGLLYGRRELLRAARNQNHFFIGDDEVPYKLEPGNVNHELTASLVGILAYLEAIDAHHGGHHRPRAERLERVFRLFADHEQALVAPLLAYLGSRRDVRLLGPATADAAVRAPIVAFTVEGRRASEIPVLLEREQVAVRWGHFYAHRACEALGLLERDGVVRASLAHYNTPGEVERLIAALDRALA